MKNNKYKFKTSSFSAFFKFSDTFKLCQINKLMLSLNTIVITIYWSNNIILYNVFS